MRDLFIRTTTCMRGWPLVYTVYHQELEPPYRHAAWCVVFRCGRRGLVVGRWTAELLDEDVAHAVALGARPTEAWWGGRDHTHDEPDDGSFGCLVPR